MKSKFKKFSILFIILFPFFPFLALAAPKDLTDLLGVFINLLDLLSQVLMSLAVLFFLWGVALFILKADSDTEREKGKKVMFWGIIGLFVMVSVWGLVGLVSETLFGGGDTAPVDQGIWI